MAVRRLNHAVLYVHDLASAVEFYTTALGFEVRTEIAGQAAFLRAPGSANDHDLGLFGIGGAPTPARAPPPPGVFHPASGGGTPGPPAGSPPAAAGPGPPGGGRRHPRGTVPYR